MGVIWITGSRWKDGIDEGQEDGRLEVHAEAVERGLAEWRLPEGYTGGECEPEFVWIAGEASDAE
jgi:hypothetical protein